MSLNTCACGCGCPCGFVCCGKPKKTDEGQQEHGPSGSKPAHNKAEPADKSKTHDGTSQGKEKHLTGKKSKDPHGHQRKSTEELKHVSTHSMQRSSQLFHRRQRSSHSSSESMHASEADGEGSMAGRQLTPYECQLEDDVQKLQEALFTMTSQYAKVQFRLRQIAAASDSERITLLKELERMTREPLDGSRRDQEDKLATLQSDAMSLGNVRIKQRKIIAQLRGRLLNLADSADDYFVTDREGQRRGDQTMGDGADEQDYVLGEEELQGNASKATFLSEAWSDTIHVDSESDGEQSRSKSKSKHRKGKGKNKKGGKNAQGGQGAHGGAGDRHSRGECSKDCPSYRARRKSGSVGRSLPKNNLSKNIGRMSSKDVSPNSGRLYSVLRQTQSVPHYQRRAAEEGPVKKVRSAAKNHSETVPKRSRCKPDLQAKRRQKASATPSENLAKGWPLSWRYLRLDEPPCTKSSMKMLESQQSVQSTAARSR
ncbi:uncharacterized protein LOC111077464 [Drosophila obscura]|uniref:uncharacterized protein LOC111077464 n=1 Tax=Drosophila obscura TaxID=7282 RepID=UPI001BB200EB|nr:uncharacterized protein LOC111077464 [Drosophila obscura]